MKWTVALIAANLFCVFVIWWMLDQWDVKQRTFDADCANAGGIVDQGREERYCLKDGRILDVFSGMQED